MESFRKHEGGFLIIEALIAVVIFAMVGLSLFSSITLLQLKARRAKYDAEASLLVQEATEIAHSALFIDWNGYDDGVYSPVYEVENDQWTLFPGEETDLRTRFTRGVRLIRVCRDLSTGNQMSDFEETGVCTGEIDENSRIVESEITWVEKERERRVKTRLLVFRVPDQ